MKNILLIAAFTIGVAVTAQAQDATTTKAEAKTEQAVQPVAGVKASCCASKAEAKSCAESKASAQTTDVPATDATVVAPPACAGTAAKSAACCAGKAEATNTAPSRTVAQTQTEEEKKLTKQQ